MRFGVVTYSSKREGESERQLVERMWLQGAASGISLSVLAWQEASEQLPHVPNWSRALILVLVCICALLVPHVGRRVDAALFRDKSSDNAPAYNPFQSPPVSDDDAIIDISRLGCVSSDDHEDQDGVNTDLDNMDDFEFQNWQLKRECKRYGMELV
ncbi:hypothetical protein FVE85_6221 [Porphyridium purpureum]|uniref:Uncharacterized protein n=1 Tax=Porphyridium purpureum TaxID=35688 RepID=A0A5J4Z4P0_PORPP|nr:hypothetical protein FVE85_6221 [Porphyridium purpureum]|eukprot:POR5708..scf295_1